MKRAKTSEKRKSKKNESEKNESEKNNWHETGTNKKHEKKLNANVSSESSKLENAKKQRSWRNWNAKSESAKHGTHALVHALVRALVHDPEMISTHHRDEHIEIDTITTPDPIVHHRGKESMNDKATSLDAAVHDAVHHEDMIPDGKCPLGIQALSDHVYEDLNTNMMSLDTHNNIPKTLATQEFPNRVPDCENMKGRVAASMLDRGHALMDPEMKTLNITGLRVIASSISTGCNSTTNKNGHMDTT